MTCEEFERVLLDSSSTATTRNWLLRASSEALAQAHIQNCPACAAKMRGTARLESALDELRFSTRHMQAPVAVEKNLLEAFHRQAARRNSSERAALPSRLMWLPAAAVVLLAIGLLFLSRQQPSLTRTQNNARSQGQVQGPLPSTGSSAAQKDANGNHSLPRENQVSRARSRVANSVKPIPRAVGVRARAELNDELSLNGGGSIVRVTLPLSSLTAMGLPVHGDLADPRVTADVWMDPFGDVMKVRLVAENRSAN